jgi:hypothetical protein
MAHVETEMCPFLIPTVVDRLWLYPVSGYCRRPDRGMFVPAPATLERVCASPAHRRCPGYRASLAADPWARNR